MEVDPEMEEPMKARPYQGQLEDIAMKKNTIIHLPTGSGKTFIAIRLITRFREALRKPWGAGGKRTFFLVNTIPLVEQQKKVIQKLCPVEGVGAYSGEDRVDYWKKAKWDQELTIYQVVVMTSQILSDMLTHKYIRIEDINLLIFDECHHAVDDHPMRLVMKHFEDCPMNKQPRVLGLTATLLNGNAGTLAKIEETLRCLETTFHATIATVNELGEVLEYSTNPCESVLFYRPLRLSSAAMEAIDILTHVMRQVVDVELPRFDDPELKLERHQQDITTDPKKIVKAVMNMIGSMISFIQELGVYGGSLTILAYVILLERLKRKAVTKEEALLYKVVISKAISARDILEASMEDDTGYQRIVKHSSEQVLQMLNVLKEYSPNVMNRPGVCLSVNRKRKPLSGIIFTQQRFTAKIIYNILKEVQKENPEEFGFLQADFIVGFNVNPFKNTRELHYMKKTSQTALLKFGNKELNLLISTSVIEEGVDIPQCALVMRYDPPLEYRSYIQSKGRARSSDASYLILSKEADKKKFMDKYLNFQSTEQYIQRMLVGSTDDRDAPSQGTIQEELYDEDEIPSFVSENGNRLSAVQAISLLNRYCSVLPHDQFTVITPKWIAEKVEVIDRRCKVVKRVVTITMPIACPVKEPIRGNPFFNLKSAKRSAALNACIRLHQEDELDALTMLPKHYGSVNFEQEDVRQCFPNWPWDDPTEDAPADAPKPGTKKRIRKHKKVFPLCLNGPSDWKFGQRTFYLHVLKLKTAFPKPTESREVALYEFLQQNEGYGFITAEKLPTLCEFPMFLTVGEVTTSLEVNYASVPLNKDLFELIKQFHLFLYDQVLEVAKKFLAHVGTVNCLYTVPVKLTMGQYVVDWDVIQTYTEVRPVAVPSYEERRRLKVTRESYKYAVVTPWYRGNILPDRYIVSDVLEYMTPLSRFGDESYESYEDYYNNKYNLQVVGPKDQPLLEVRNINSRMNCLMPRAATLNALSDKQKKLISSAQGDDRPKSFQEVFIPEYCLKYEYPGVLWYKATMLPSIVHRIFMLLVADDLRVQIAMEASIGHVNLRKGEKWKPVEVDSHIATKALLSQVESPAEINTIDRINNPINESTPRPKVVTMKEAVYQLQKKRINKEYPWDARMEPIDIERNISTVTVMDIECYDEFVNASIAENLEEVVHWPPRAHNSHLALRPPPLRYNDKIALLSNTSTGRGPELRDVLSALTTIKSGDTFNLERVETLGDSFLKFAATLYLFHKFPGLNEGQLTNIKCRLIGNRNLYYAGERVRLGGRMKVEQFSPRKDFLVPGFFAPVRLHNFIEEKKIKPTFLIGMEFDRAEKLSGDLTPDSWARVQRRYRDDTGEVEQEKLDNVQAAMQGYVRAQAVADKSVADCVEALIGTYLLSSGISGAVKVLEWFRVLPKEDNFQSQLQKSVPTAISLGKATDSDIDFLLNNCRQDIERILDYKFRDASFLLEALSHPSYIRNRQTRSYERLEFLGDAILDFLITAHVFENSRDLKPGELTDLRSALVNNVTFASYVVKLGLHKFICTQFNPCLDSAIISFVEHQEQRDHEIVEDVLTLIDEEDCHIAEYVEVPKVLSDIFESLAGAIYLDSAGDLEAVWRVYYRIMCREIDAFSSNIPKQPVRLLHECIHACPSIGDAMLTPSELPKVMVPVTVSRNGSRITVHGFGNNKFQAKRAAAKIALKILGVSS